MLLPCVISAFVGESQLTLGEIKSETKRGEIKEIPKLLDIIDVKGHIVTIDSIGCQHDIVEKLCSKKVGADYVIGLKGNQKNLHKAVEEYFMYNPTSDRSAKKNVYEAGHGRVEQREYWLETDALRLGYDEPEKWRELVRQQLPQICDKIGISVSNLEYSAAVHPDKGHPHCHLMFWDKKQDIKKFVLEFLNLRCLREK